MVITVAALSLAGLSCENQPPPRSETPPSTSQSAGEEQEGEKQQSALDQSISDLKVTASEGADQTTDPQTKELLNTLSELSPESAEEMIQNGHCSTTMAVADQAASQDNELPENVRSLYIAIGMVAGAVTLHAAHADLSRPINRMRVARGMMYAGVSLTSIAVVYYSYQNDKETVDRINYMGNLVFAGIFGAASVAYIASVARLSNDEVVRLGRIEEVSQDLVNKGYGKGKSFDDLREAAEALVDDDQAKIAQFSDLPDKAVTNAADLRAEKIPANAKNFRIGAAAAIGTLAGYVGYTTITGSNGGLNLKSGPNDPVDKFLCSCAAEERARGTAGSDTTTAVDKTCGV